MQDCDQFPRPVREGWKKCIYLVSRSSSPVRRVKRSQEGVARSSGGGLEKVGGVKTGRRSKPTGGTYDRVARLGTQEKNTSASDVDRNVA